jgi:hypothetical protein
MPSSPSLQPRHGFHSQNPSYRTNALRYFQVPSYSRADLQPNGRHELHVGPHFCTANLVHIHLYHNTNRLPPRTAVSSLRVRHVIKRALRGAGEWKKGKGSPRIRFQVRNCAQANFFVSRRRVSPTRCECSAQQTTCGWLRSSSAFITPDAVMVWRAHQCRYGRRHAHP